jgi:hypothetical protein
MMPTRSELAFFALVTLAAVGCTTPTKREPVRVAGVRRLAVPPIAEDTISAREAAEILRRAALVRGLSHTRPDETWEAAQELGAVWRDAEGRPEEAALLTLIDEHLLAKKQPDRDSGTAELRIELARAWLDRGDHERARAQITRVQHDVSMAGPDDQAELLVAIGSPLGVEITELLEAGTETRIRAIAAARWGDTAKAESALDELEAEDRCRVAVALSARSRRDGLAAGTARWQRVAEDALDDIGEAVGRDFVACLASLGLELARAGDRAGAARVFGRIGGRETPQVCELLYEIADRVDPVLLDGPLLAAAQSGAANPSVTWFGCSSLLAEIAARRGDRRLAQRMWTRAQGDFDGWEEDRGYDRVWMTSIRLGRLDPLEPHGLSPDAFRPLALARIYDEQPESRVDPARLAAALAPEPDAAGVGEGEVGDPAEDAEDPGDAP